MPRQPRLKPVSCQSASRPRQPGITGSPRKWHSKNQRSGRMSNSATTWPLPPPAAVAGDVGDPVHHQHRRCRKLRVARPEHLAAGAGHQPFEVDARWPAGHLGDLIAGGGASLPFPRRATSITCPAAVQGRSPGRPPPDVARRQGPSRQLWLFPSDRTDRRRADKTLQPAKRHRPPPAKTRAASGSPVPASGRRGSGFRSPSSLSATAATGTSPPRGCTRRRVGPGRAGVAGDGLQHPGRAFCEAGLMQEVTVDGSALLLRHAS